MAAKLIAVFLCFAMIGCLVQHTEACPKFYAMMARAGVRSDVIDRLRAFEGLRPFRPISEGLRPLLSYFRPAY